MFPRRPRIFVPCSYDVLFGKGSSVQTFEGNKRMREIVGKRQKAATYCRGCPHRFFLLSPQCQVHADTSFITLSPLPNDGPEGATAVS